jgi:hypothetical protein
MKFFLQGRMKRMVLLFICALWAINVNAQNKWDKDTDVFVDIDGVEIGDKPSREELAKHFGTPISDEYIEADLLNYYRITYDGLIINVEEDGTVRSFILESSEYPVMTLYGVGDGIRVGDRWDKSQIAQYPVYDIEEMDGYHEGEVWYNVTMWYKGYTFDHVTSFIVKEGIIIEIYSWPYEA